MTTKTGIAEIQANELTGFHRAVRRVAVGTDQLSFKQRVAARQAGLGPHILVTVVAGVCLADSLEYRLPGCVGVMAITADKVFD